MPAGVPSNDGRNKLGETFQAVSEDIVTRAVTKDVFSGFQGFSTAAVVTSKKS